MEGFLQSHHKITFYMSNNNYDNAILNTNFNSFENFSPLNKNEEVAGFWQEIKIESIEPFSINQEIFNLMGSEKNKRPTYFFTEEEQAELDKMDEMASFSLKPLIF
jgi:saccharopine dehydrogenase-like NADP-dependent oxidoreductase